MFLSERSVNMEKFVQNRTAWVPGYHLGDRIRFFTNMDGMIYGDHMSTFGEITGLRLNRYGELIKYVVRNSMMTYEVWPNCIIGFYAELT
jgi:hypothetical protein